MDASGKAFFVGIILSFVACCVAIGNLIYVLYENLRPEDPPAKVVSNTNVPMTLSIIVDGHRFKVETDGKGGASVTEEKPPAEAAP